MEIRARTRARSPAPSRDQSAWLQLDAGFPARVRRTTLIVAAVVSLLIDGHFGWRVAAGFAAGALLATGDLLAIEWAVRQFAGAAVRNPRKLALVVIGKLPVMALLIWGVYRLSGRNDHVMAGLVAGATLVPLVIILKVLSRAWLAYDRGGARSGEGRTDG